MKPKIVVPEAEVAGFCGRWKISELALFGSVLRGDFGPNSDIDVLVTFAEDSNWSLFDQLEMEEELGALVGRKVDFVERRTIEQSKNWIRRRSILETAQPYYVAR